MKSLLAAFILLLNSAAYAYQIRAVTYDKFFQLVTVDLVYQGGEKEHNFTPVFDSCDKTTVPFGLAVRLEDTGWDDTGSNLLNSSVKFFIPDNTCTPVELTVFAGRSRSTIGID
jgi:hypothetical protein